MKPSTKAAIAEVAGVTVFGLGLLLAAIMIFGPTAGEHSLAHKVAMFVLMGN